MEQLYNICEQTTGTWAGHWYYVSADEPAPDGKKLIDENLTKTEAQNKCDKHNQACFAYATE